MRDALWRLSPATGRVRSRAGVVLALGAHLHRGELHREGGRVVGPGGDTRRGGPAWGGGGGGGRGWGVVWRWGGGGRARGGWACGGRAAAIPSLAAPSSPTPRRRRRDQSAQRLAEFLFPF